LNYRFKFIKTPKFDAFVNAKFAALTFSSMEYTVIPFGGMATVYKESGSDFSAPFTFGIGADYKVGNGYITFNYNDILGLNVDSNEEFPLDLTLGYKFNL
jgi:carbohydrate-selective porin OprB